MSIALQLLALAYWGSATAADTYPVYRNWQYSYQIAHPPFLIGQGVSDAGDGQRFVSKNGDAQLRVTGWPCVDETDYPTRFLQEYDQSAKARKHRITYRHKTATRAVVSGYHGEKIFYSKALFEEGWCARFTLEYAPAARAHYDKVVGRIASSFKPLREMPQPR